MQDGSMLRHAWAKWRRGQLLPFDSVPNLLLGREAVPEFKLWERGAGEGVVGTLQQLLQRAGSSSSSSGVQQQVWQQHRAVLQEALLKLVPPPHHQQQQQQ
jgi:hypothetical protein